MTTYYRIYCQIESWVEEGKLQPFDTNSIHGLMYHIIDGSSFNTLVGCHDCDWIHGPHGLALLKAFLIRRKFL